MARVTLTPETRDFFGNLAELVALNPFSEERTALIERLAPGHAGGAWSVDPSDYALTAVVDRRLAELDRAGRGTLNDFADEDRPFVGAAYLYQAYQRLVPELDALIKAHELDRSTPAEVPFARDALAAIVRRGFTDEQALFNFAFAFQLRRAFFFIVDSLSGTSDCMRRLRQQLWNSVFTFDLRNYRQVLVNHLEDFSTLLVGETGAGKGQAAVSIGRSGFIPFDAKANRFAVNYNEAFIAANLSRFAETLIESELFGHRKGAFTGAVDDHQGLLERCSEHGSLFLDEIGDLSLQVQVKLLEVLQSRTFTSVGGKRLLRFSGRVIGATNRPLEALRRAGSFREDFFYRLCSDVIQVPALRQRIAESADELPLLVERMIARITGGRHPNLTGLVLERLDGALSPDHPWPGNVRELEQVVRAILLTGEYQGNPLGAASADPALALAGAMQHGALSAEELLRRYCTMLYGQLGTYEAVARRVRLDRRTVRKYVGGPAS